MDHVQRRILDLEMRAMAEVASAHREEYMYAERIRKESAHLADELQQSARAYVRATIDHQKTLLQNEAHKYECKAKDVCNESCNDLTIQAQSFERKELEARRTATAETALAQEGLRKAHSEVATVSRKCPELQEQAHLESSARLQAAGCVLCKNRYSSGRH